MDLSKHEEVVDLASTEEQQSVAALRKLVEKMETALAREKQKLQRVEEEMSRILDKYQLAVELLKMLEGDKQTVTVELKLPVEYTALADMPIWKAALSILREKRTAMTGREILTEMRRRGRDIKSPHAVYMISEALKRKPEFVEYTKKGGKNVFRAKGEVADKNKAEG